MLTKLKLRFQEWVINYFFEREFRFFKYPFETIDYRINHLTDDERSVYAESLKRWYDSKAYKMESEEMKKLFYKELSISTSNEIARSAYRLCLLYVRKCERRYQYLSTDNNLEKSFNNLKSK